MRPRTATLALLTLSFAVAGCGGSNGIQQAPSAASTIPSGTATTATATTPATTATTPKSGPLSKAPKITAGGNKPVKKLIIKDLVKGTGQVIPAGASITVNYIGALYKSGQIFNNTFTSGGPATFSLSEVIPGWTQGIPGMRIGGRRELIIPASMAYGATARPGIPANSALLFVIDALGISSSSGT